MPKLWFLCPKFTVQVNTNDNDIIVWTAPFTWKFIGQPLQNLVNWASRFGSIKIEEL